MDVVESGVFHAKCCGWMVPGQMNCHILAIAICVICSFFILVFGWMELYKLWISSLYAQNYKVVVTFICMHSLNPDDYKIYFMCLRHRKQFQIVVHNLDFNQCIRCIHCCQRPKPDLHDGATWDRYFWIIMNRFVAVITDCSTYSMCQRIHQNFIFQPIEFTCLVQVHMEDARN